MLFLVSGNAKIGLYDFSNSLYDYVAFHQRERNTHTEALFDCVICKKNSVIEKIRFGAGGDWHFKLSI